MGLKFGLVGCAASRSGAPYHDPSWKFFAQNDIKGVKRYDAGWFEIHDQGFMSTSPDWKTLWDWLKGEFVINPPADPADYAPKPDGTWPVYMIAPHPDVPGSVAYPLEAVRRFIEEATGGFVAYAETPWILTSTQALMFALAMMKIMEARKTGESDGDDSIGLWGVEMAGGTEYFLQKPGIRTLYQMARKLGIKVIVPVGSYLFSVGPHYGLEARPLLETQIEEKIIWVRKEIDRVKRELKLLELQRAQVVGASQSADWLEKRIAQELTGLFAENGETDPEARAQMSGLVARLVGPGLVEARKDWKSLEDQINGEIPDWLATLHQYIGQDEALKFIQDNSLQ